MTLASKRAAFPEAFKPKKLSDIKDKDEKRFRVEDAARTMKRAGEIKREIEDIKADPELFEAAKAILNQEMSDTKKAIKS